MIWQLKGQGTCCLFDALLFESNGELSVVSNIIVKDLCNACADKMWNCAIVSPMPSPALYFVAFAL